MAPSYLSWITTLCGGLRVQADGRWQTKDTCWAEPERQVGRAIGTEGRQRDLRDKYLACVVYNVLHSAWATYSHCIAKCLHCKVTICLSVGPGVTNLCEPESDFIGTGLYEGQPVCYTLLKLYVFSASIQSCIIINYTNLRDYNNHVEHTGADSLHGTICFSWRLRSRILLPSTFPISLANLTVWCVSVP